jgi:hypothetical protein
MTERKVKAAEDVLVAPVKSGDRRALARAITLVESTRASGSRAGGTALLLALCLQPARPSASVFRARRAPANRPSSKRSARI